MWQRRKKQATVLLIGLLASVSILSPETQFVQAFLTQDGLVTSKQGFYSASYPGKNLVNGNFKDMCHSSARRGPHWFRIEMDREYLIETILVQNREDCCTTRINPTYFYVGNFDDMLLNDKCGGTVRSSGVYACGLTGKYIYMYQDNTSYQNILEVRAYPWKNIAPTATTRDDVGCWNGCARYGGVKCLQKLTGWNLRGRTLVCVANRRNKPYFKYDLGSEKYIKAVFLAGRNDGAWHQSRYWTVSVGNDGSVTGSNTKCLGEDKNAGQEVTCNALGRYVFVAKRDTNYLTFHHISIYEGCDCSGVTWLAPPEIPDTLWLGETRSYEFILGYESTITPDCPKALEMCHPLVTFTLQSGDPLPDFITVDGLIVTVAPTDKAHVGIYLLMASMKTYEGRDEKSVEFPGGTSSNLENLQITVNEFPPITCQLKRLIPPTTPLVVEYNVLDAEMTVDLSPGFRPDEDCGLPQELTWSVPAGAPIVTSGLQATIYSAEESHVGSYTLTLTSSTTQGGVTISNSVSLVFIVSVRVNDPCLTTELIPVQDPKDQKIFIGNGRAVQ